MTTDVRLGARKPAWCAVTVLTLLLISPNLIWLWFEHSAGAWVSGLIVPVTLLLLLFALLGDWIWIACLLLTPFAGLAPVEVFYVFNYHHPTSSQVLATTFATNLRETREYLGNALVPLLLCIAGGLVLALLAAWWSKRARLCWSHNSRAWILVIGITVPLAAGIVTGMETKGGATDRWHGSQKTLGFLAKQIEPGYPFGLYQRIASYHAQWEKMRQDASRLESFRFHAYQVLNINRRQIYVLTIGEASRRNHWQLFGYGRTTNPELTRLSDVVPISDFDSSWPESIHAIPMIVTRKPVTDTSMNWKEASILRAMQEAGFETWWISNQLAIGKFDSPVSAYAYEAQHVQYLNHSSWSAPGSYDGDMLQPLRDALLNSKRDEFIVLHMMGSHLDYDFRYPETYKHFRPTQADPTDSIAQGEHISNSYDNTILYTDHVLAAIIGILRDSGAVSALWYESDHGETLPTPTCSVEGHGLGTLYDYQIPVLFWYSDAYASTFPDRVAALRVNSEKPATSANTFDSLIDMAGVNFPGHDATWSLFSRYWHFRPRVVNGPWQVDIDHAQFTKDCELVFPVKR